MSSSLNKPVRFMSLQIDIEGDAEAIGAAVTALIKELRLTSGMYSITVTESYRARMPTIDDDDT